MATTRGGTRGQYHCSFCGKSQDQVRRLIAGPGAVYICDECVDLCREIIDEESAPPAAAKPRLPLAKLPTPEYQIGVSLPSFALAFVLTGLFQTLSSKQAGLAAETSTQRRG